MKKESKERKPATKTQKICFAILVVIIIVAVALLFGSDSEVDYTKFDEDNLKVDYYTAMEEMVDSSTDGSVTIPKISDDGWTYADYDNKDDGMVMISGTADVNGSSEDLTAVISVTKGEDDDEPDYHYHYLCIGSTLYVDDGKCDETMAKLGMPTND